MPPRDPPRVLEAVITALQKDCALEVRYEDARGQRATARLHPQALLQRGPIPYLFALKNDEIEPVHTYALHRMLRGRALLTVPGRPAEGFDLDQALASGQVDCGRGQVIDLELRVRGYAAEMLRVCPITPTQRMEEEPANSSFLARVRVQVPETGALLRWLLGLGDNVEVVAPAGLRQVMGEQIAKMARHYAPLSVTGEVAGQKAERHQASAGHGKPSPSCEDHVGARR